MTRTAATRNKPRKWIDRRIAELDPEVDYVEIVRLSTLYRVNDLQLHWFYAVGTPAAGISPAVIDAVWRAGSGTYRTEPDRRRDDSVDHLLMWVEHGPNNAVTQASVGMVNKYHSHFARFYPGGFAKAEDYIYIICLNATLFHRASCSLGLNGLSPKEQRAAWLFWSQVAHQFDMAASGDPVTQHADFPPSFADMVTLVEDYISRPWPVHQPGHESTTSAIEHFATTWFPRPLHPFGRALITAFLPAGLRRAHDIPAPPRPAPWPLQRAPSCGRGSLPQLACPLTPMSRS